MTAIIAIHFKPIWFSIHPNDSQTLDIPFTQSLRFINPLVHANFAPDIKAHLQIADPYLYAIKDDNVVLPTSHLILAVHQSIIQKADPEVKVITENEPIYQLMFEVGRILQNLRYKSKQVHLPSDFNDLYMIAEAEISDIPEITFPDVDLNSESFLRRDFIETAITWKHLHAAVSMARDTRPPTFDTILLDSIGAFSEHDFRRSILYSAMAVEILAATKLDDHYEQDIRQGGVNSNLRVVTIPQAGGKTTIKDPVYEYLANRSDFSQLLHERPLYVMRRSLLLENQQLFQMAIKLYRTRNKIVHRGDPPIGNEEVFFTIDQSGAFSALKCAINVFEWFGETEEYFIPKPELVKSKAPKRNN